MLLTVSTVPSNDGFIYYKIIQYIKCNKILFI